MQRADQHAVFGCGDPHTLRIAEDVAAGRSAGFVHVVDPAALAGQADWPSLQGPHNLQNAAIAGNRAPARPERKPVAPGAAIVQGLAAPHGTRG
jgi:UDP-N-acetylmuramoylalanine--D-glutamate ligase